MGSWPAASIVLRILFRYASTVIYHTSQSIGQISATLGRMHTHGIVVKRASAPQTPGSGSSSFGIRGRSVAPPFCAGCVSTSARRFHHLRQSGMWGPSLFRRLRPRRRQCRRGRRGSISSQARPGLAGPSSGWGSKFGGTRHWTCGKSPGSRSCRLGRA